MATHDSPRTIGLRQGSHLVRTIGAEVRSLRLAAGVTQKSLAERAGISREHLCRLELGRVAHVDVGTAAVLFALLGQRLTVKAFPVGEPIRDQASCASSSASIAGCR